jgi:hypothetical protein
MVQDQAERTTAQIRESVKNLKTIALSEAWKILQLVVAGVVQIIEAIATDLEGKDKKAIAMEYISGFYDKVLVAVDIPFVPSFIEPVIHGYIKSILMILVSSSIDATVTIFRQTGVFIKKGTV